MSAQAGEKLSHSSVQSAISFQTPFEWLLYLLEQNGEMPQHHLPLIFDEAQIAKRFLLFTSAPTISPACIGEKGHRFIQWLNKKQTNSHSLFPVTAEKVQEVAMQLQEINEDLTSDAQWRNFWADCQKSLTTVEEFNQKNITKYISMLQNQILAAYRLQVLTQTDLYREHKQNSNQRAEAISQQDFFEYINFYLTQYPADLIYEKMHKHCVTRLESEKEKAFSVMKTYIKQGDFSAALLLLEQTPKNLAYDISFEFLGKDQAQAILASLTEKYQQLLLIVQAIDQMIQTICTQVIPGFPLESVIHQEVDKVKSQRLFKKISEVGPVAVARYLNSDEIIKKIYNLILQVRVEHFKPLLQNPDEDFASFRRELKKITVYRSRCNIITQLFEEFSPKPVSLFMTLSKEQEDQLIILQQEYLQAVSRQIERMDHVSANLFLNECKHLPVLQPLPATTFLKWKNDFALSELNFLINTLNLPSASKDHEEIPLHNIDSPVEIDILGVITRELTEAAGSEHDELEDFSLIVEVLKKSYKNLQEPTFKPQPDLTEMMLNEKNFEFIKNKLILEKNLFLRKQQLLTLYDFVKQNETKFENHKQFFFPNKKSGAQSAKQFLETLYWEAINEQLNEFAWVNKRSEYMAYHTIILDAQHSNIGQDYLAREKIPLPPTIDTHWQNLLNQPISPVLSLLSSRSRSI